MSLPPHHPQFPRIINKLTPQNRLRRHTFLDPLHHRQQDITLRVPVEFCVVALTLTYLPGALAAVGVANQYRSRSGRKKERREVVMGREDM